MNDKIHCDIEDQLCDIAASMQMIRLEINKKTDSKLEIIQEIAAQIASNGGSIIGICRKEK